MNVNSYTFDVRWADIDFNQHMRHSAFADYAAHARLTVLANVGLTLSKLAELKIGPVLFREELTFRKELFLNEKITIVSELLKTNADYSKWTICSKFYREDATFAAQVIVDGAWIDLTVRKIAKSNSSLSELFASVPKSNEFSIEN